VTRPRWTKVTLRLGNQGAALDGDIRLAALLRWLRSEAPPHLAVFDPAGLPLTGPEEVDWANFPLEEALLAAQAVGHFPA
jgi:hypothetical protein